MIRKPCTRRGGAALALLALLLQACGGGDEGPTAQATRKAAAASHVQPLLDDDGGVMPADPQAVPADPGAWTRSGHYATRAQAERETDADLIHLDVACCSAEAAELAVLTAYGLQAARNLPNSAMVLVQGPDLRLVASVANRLEDGGLTRVFVVTP